MTDPSSVETAEIATNLDVIEKEVKPREFVKLILATLVWHTMGKVSLINQQMVSIVSDDRFVMAARQVALDTESNLRRLLEVATTAQNGSQFDEAGATGRRYFYIGKPLDPQARQEGEISTSQINPKKAVDQAKLVDLVCQALENRTRQDLSGIIGYVELGANRSDDPEVKSGLELIGKFASGINSEVLFIEQRRENVFRGEKIGVRLVNGKEILALPMTPVVQTS